MKTFIWIFLILLSSAFLVPGASDFENKISKDGKKKILVVLPNTNVIKPGEKYEARVFVYTVPKEKYEFSWDGGKIETDETGMGKIIFTATPGFYDSMGLAKKAYKVIAKGKGKGDTLTVEKDYFVSRSRDGIEIDGPTVASLYEGCGNEIYVNVPSEGKKYNPSIRASGAIIIVGKKAGEIILIPKGKKVSLEISSNSKWIGEKSFSVRKVPTPTIQVFLHNRLIDLTNSYSINQLDSLYIRATPEESFALLMPKDAKYEVAEWEIMLYRVDKLITSKLLTEEVASIKDVLSNAKRGDRLILQAKKVLRRNYQNRVELVDIKKQATVISIK